MILSVLGSLPIARTDWPDKKINITNLPAILEIDWSGAGQS